MSDSSTRGPSEDSDEPRAPLRELDGWPRRHGLHLLVLWGFAVLQPVLSQISGEDNALLFFALRTERPWVYVVVFIAFAVIPPALLLGIEAICRRIGRRLGAFAHTVAVWVLASLLMLTVLINIFPSWVVKSLLLCWVLGAVATAAYIRLEAVRLFLSVLAPAPALFLLVFFLSGTPSKLIFPSDPELAQASTKTPLVMVVFDEFPVTSLLTRNRRIDPVRYPNFARLSRHATWFRNTVSSADLSLFAVPSILTGRKADVDKQLPFPLDHPDSLFTMLGRSHAVNGIEYRVRMCPSELCPSERSAGQQLVSLGSSLTLTYLYTLKPPRLGVTFPGLGSTPQEALRAKDVHAKPDVETSEISELRRYGDLHFERFLSEIKPASERGARPPLYYLHVGLPHVPWVFTPSGKAYSDHYDDLPGLDPIGEGWDDEPNHVRQAYQRHLLQVEFVDRLVGRLIRKLKQTGLYDRSAVALVSDHGASFNAGGNRRLVKRGTGADIGLVPFFLKAPNQTEGRTVDRLVPAVDVLPTIADVLGARVPPGTDGRSALSGPGPDGASIQAFVDDPLRFSKAELVRQQARTLRQKLLLFGSGGDRRALYGLGPGRLLIGRDPRSVRRAPAVDARLQLDRRDEFDDVDPGGRYVPAIAKGLIDGDDARGVRDVAISVNGRIAASGPSFEIPGTDLRGFALVLQESTLHPGGNDVRAFAVSGGSRPRLAPLEVAGP